MVTGGLTPRAAVALVQQRLAAAGCRMRILTPGSCSAWRRGETPACPSAF